MQENLQQAEKIYFKSGKLEDAYKQAILKITGGDVYTKLVADLVFHFAKGNVGFSDGRFDAGAMKMGEELYNNLKTYNKNLFPVPGNFNDYNQEHNDYHVLNLAAMLRERTYMIKQWNNLPGIAKRNLKLQVPTGYVNGLEYWYRDKGNKLKQLFDLLDNLPNPDKFYDSDVKAKKQQLRDTLLNKIFNTKTNLDSSLEIAKHFAYGYNGNDDDISQQNVLDMLEYVNAEVMQNSNDVMVIRVQDQEAMQRLGCISTWCFARPGGEGWWNDYASNGFAYVIFDFKRDPSDALFLMVVIPGTYEIYASTNVLLSDVGIEDEYNYLKQIGVDFSIIYNDSYEDKSQHYNDDEEENEVPVRKMQPKSKQQVTNSNQLSLDFPQPELRQVAELRKRIRSILRETVRTGKNQQIIPERG